MKIVILDGFTLNPGDLSWEGLDALGDVTLYDRTEIDDDKIIDRIGDAEIVITNKTPINKNILDQCQNLKYIGVLATGYNVVDVAYAKEKNIPVTNVPTYGTDAVAQFVFALMLELSHHVWHHSQTVKSGRWAKSVDFCYWDFPLIELKGKTLGIVGFGRIGQRTAEIAMAFGMNVLAYDMYPNKALEKDNLHYVALEELYGASDFISLHCPLFESNKGMIDKTAISKMKDGVFIINTSRGPLINEVDLKAALDSAKVAGAAVDVVSTEPIESDNPLLQCENCIITPHIAWAPKEARGRLLNTAVDNLAAFVKGKGLNIVNDVEV